MEICHKSPEANRAKALQRSSRKYKQARETHCKNMSVFGFREETLGVHGIPERGESLNILRSRKLRWLATHARGISMDVH
jgi:hypothetical protein